MDHLRRLVAHLGWADELALSALRSADPADPTALEIYRHVLGAEEVWLSRLEGRQSSLAVWPTLTLEECAMAARANFERLTRYLGSLSPRDLARGTTYTNSAGREFTSSVEDILLHVCLHGAYHRGQVALALRRAGATPNPTDYIAFVRGSPAATRADAERRSR